MGVVERGLGTRLHKHALSANRQDILPTALNRTGMNLGLELAALRYAPGAYVRRLRVSHEHPLCRSLQRRCGHSCGERNSLYGFSHVLASFI